MKKIMLSAATLAVLHLGAAPQIMVTGISQDASKRVKVDYVLEGAAVVTMQIQTNTLASGEGEWVSIGDDKVRHVFGDVNMKVEAGSRTAFWKPTKDWPDRSIDRGVRAVMTAWATNAPPPYMLIDLTAAVPAKGTVRFFASEDALPCGRVTEDRIYKSDWLVMRKIPASHVQWRTGAALNEPLTYGNCSGARECCYQTVLTEDYYMAVFETTDRQFHYLAGWDRGLFQGRDDSPCRAVTRLMYSHIRGNVNWPVDGRETVGEGCVLANARAHTGVMLDLPTSAEWEFAARGGVGSSLFDGNWATVDGEDPAVAAIAWYHPNSIDQFEGAYWDCAPHEVGLKPANAFGLYDVLGNVEEWVLDWYQEGALTSELKTDPVGPRIDSPADSDLRILRGGGINAVSGKNVRLAMINMNTTTGMTDSQGFRLWAPAVAP